MNLLSILIHDLSSAAAFYIKEGSRAQVYSTAVDQKATVLLSNSEGAVTHENTGCMLFG